VSTVSAGVNDGDTGEAVDVEGVKARKKKAVDDNAGRETRAKKAKAAAN
jgi:hypothetical protein